MKKLFAILVSLAMILTFASCAKTYKNYASSTVTGKVTEVNGNTVTVKLGALSEGGGQGQMQSPDGMPEGEAPTDENGETLTRPEMPQGEAPTDENGETLTRPEKPQGEGTDTDNASGSAQNAVPSIGSSASDRPEPPERNGSLDSSQRPEPPQGERPQRGSGAESSDTQSASNAETPSGSESNGNQQNGTPPEMPSGMGQRGMGSQQSFTESEESLSIDLGSVTVTKNNEEITISSLNTGDIISITFDKNGKPASAEVVITSDQNSGQGTVEQGSSATTINTDGEYKNESYTSQGDDENALRIDSAEVTLDSITVDKSAGASSNTENGDFYGVNAALLATNGATVTIKNAEVTSSAQNGNGVFSYGSGTTVNITDSTITTSADNSGGIQTTGGATTNASNLTVTTSGNSSAAIRSDRGGGTVKVNGGSYTSNGFNSPAVYSTANITVNNASLTANNSEALVIEGKNSINLTDCTVYGNMSDTKGASSDENVHNVMIYQSMSGDAAVGTSTFTMSGGTLTSNNGDMFYVTNTDSVIKLSNVNIVNKDTDAYLFNITGNSASHGWGTAGSNGANVTLTADSQKLEGKIRVDSVSKLDMTLTNGSSFTGSINIENNTEGGTAVENNAVLTIEEGCTFTLTGNCTLTSFTNNGTVNFNGYTITLADGTVLK